MTRTALALALVALTGAAQAQQGGHDPGFGRAVDPDIPLTVYENTAGSPVSGMIIPAIALAVLLLAMRGNDGGGGSAEPSEPGE